MKKDNYLQTDDDKTVDYNNDTKLDDLSTVQYNSDADVNITKPMTIKPKTSITQQQAKKIIKKYKSLIRKGHPITYIKNNKKSKGSDVILIKKVPLRPRDRLARAIKQQKEKEEVKFIKQILLHPRERLKRATKKLQHPRDKMKNREQQIARENISALMNGKFSFDPKKILNKTLLFDPSKIDEKNNNGYDNTCSAYRQ